MRLVPIMLVAAGSLALLAFQNCGGMRGAASATLSQSAITPDGSSYSPIITTPDQLLNLPSDATATLANDITLANSDELHFMGVNLDGAGHKISGLKNAYFSDGTLQNVEFDFTADISVLPAMQTTGFYFAYFDGTTASQVNIKATLSGTIPAQPAGQTFDLSVVNAMHGATLENLTINLTGDMSVPNVPVLSESTIGNFWNSTINNVQIHSDTTYRLGNNHLVGVFQPVNAALQSTIDGLTIDQKISFVDNGNAFTTNVRPLLTGQDTSLTNSPLTQTFNFTPQTALNLADVTTGDTSNFGMVVTGSTYTVVHP